MADQNQSPASQTSVTLSGITFPLTIAGTPTRQAAPVLSLNVAGASITPTIGGASTITLLGRALGTAATVSTSGASGLFTLNEQCTAKRLGSWP